MTPLEQALQMPVQESETATSQAQDAQETQAEAPATQTAKMEGKKTIAGEYKTASERSFIMVKVRCAAAADVAVLTCSPTVSRAVSSPRSSAASRVRTYDTGRILTVAEKGYKIVA
jgi:hypothetical protein